MPSVPTYRRQITTQGLPQARAIAEGGDTSGLQRGLNDVSNVATQIMEKKQQEADTTSLLEADNKLTEWQNNAFYNQENGVFTKKGQHAIDVTGQTLSAFDKAQQDIGASLGNDRQRLRFNQVVQQRKQSISNDLNRYEYGEHQRYMDDVDQASVQLSIDSAALNPGDPSKVGFYKQKALDVVQNRADRLGWSEEETVLQKLNTSSKLLSGVIGRVAQNDLGSAKQMFESNKDGLSADAQLRLTDHFQQEQRRLDSEARQRQVEARQIRAIARQELSGRLQDAQVALLSGVQPVDMPSKHEIVSAHGEEKGSQIYGQLSKLQEIGPTMQELRTATPEQAAAIVEAHDPTKGAPLTAEGVPIVASGFKTDAQVHSIVAKAAVQFQQQRQADPAAYVIQTSPAVQQTYLQAQQNPSAETNAAYITASFAEQKRQGVADPKVLPTQQASAIASKLTQSDPSGQAKILSDLSDTYGRAYPKVLSQLGGDAPVQTVAGMVGSANKDIQTQRSGVFSQGISRSPEFIQNTLLTGDSALKTKAYKLPPSTNAAGEITSGPDKAFYDAANGLLDPGSMRTYHAAYQSYYAGRAIQDGKYGEQFEAGYAREALAAIGLSPVEIGAGKTLPPYGMDANAFKDRISAQYSAFRKESGSQHELGDVKIYAGPNSTYVVRDALGNKLTTLKVDQ
ncbi:hypothetical protein ACYZT4_10950 [Pseudomonas sp. GB2N2]